MAKPWEQNWETQTGKPWERNYDGAEAAPAPVKEPTRAELAAMPLEQRQAVVQARMMKSPAFGAPANSFSEGVGEAIEGVGGLVDGTASMASGLGTSAVAGVTAPMVATNADDGANYVNDFVSENTYKPQTEAGRNMMTRLAQFLSPVEKTKEFLGDKTLAATNSPALATAAHMVPDSLMMLLPGARAAGEGTVRKPAEPAIKVDVSDTGQTIAKLGDNDKSVFDAQESGPYLKVMRADVDPALQGKGHGTRMMRELLDNAEGRGLTLGSDVSVSPAQARVYAKLKEDGLHVSQNPSKINPNTGNWVSTDPKKPVFEVRSKPAEAEVPGAQKSPEQVKADAVKVLLDNNVGLRTSERGDGPINQAAGKLGRAGDTFAGGPSGKQGVQNQEFTAAVFRKAGMEDVKNVTPEVMAELKENTTNLYNQAHAQDIPMDTEFVTNLADLADRAGRSPDAGVGSGIEKLIENVSKNSKVVNGKAVLPAEYVSQLRSELGSQWLSASGGGAKTIGGEFMQILDNTFERNATPAQASAAKAARLKYHQMRQIEDSLVLTDKGLIVSPNKLVNTLSRKRNRNEYHYGTGENQPLVELAKAGKQILGDKVGNSGTATRALDVGTIAHLALEPKSAVGNILNASASILTGRALNEARMGRGTAADLAQKALAEKMKAPPKAASNLKTRGAAVSQSEEEKRRLRAEAIRR